MSSVAQTVDGYIWLATEEGLVRFDGVRFTVFDTTNSALTDNYITALRAGRDGALWIRTGETLYRYAAGVIRTVCSGRSIGLSSSPMLEDRSGAIWSRAVGGINVYTAKGECQLSRLRRRRRSTPLVTSLIENERRQHSDRHDPRTEAVSRRHDDRGIRRRTWRRCP